MKKTALLVAAVAALALAAGCLQRPYPQKGYFSLGVAMPAAPAAAKKYTVVAGAATAAPGFEERLLVYRVGPNQYESDFYNELVAAPARLVADLAAQYLTAANSKARVATTQGARLADFGLETYVAALYGDFSADPPRAVARVRFTLSDLRGASARVALDKTYEAMRPLGARTPAALAAGASECLGEILRGLNADCERALR